MITRKELEDQFEVEMRRIYDRAKDELGYKPTAFLQMVEDHTGLGAAQRLLDRPVADISDGFTRLFQDRRLDLSVEATALDTRWASLFTEKQLETARRRLKGTGYESHG